MTKKETCKKCKKQQVVGNFYKSNSPMHPSGHVDICKSCIKNMTNTSDLDSVYVVLRALDKPFLISKWETACNSGQEPLGTYIRSLNMKEDKIKTWADSVFEHKVAKTNDTGSNQSASTINNKEIDFNITDAIIDFWGYGYTSEEYQAFERKYSRLKRSYSEKTEMHSEALKIYIRYRVKEELATARGDWKEAKEWGALAQKAATDAKINPNQMSKADISGGIDVLSQLFEAVESEIGIIPLLPRLLEQPYDDADMIIWSTINYGRKLEEKPRIPYRDIWNFYDEMLEEFYKSKNYSQAEIEEYKARRNNVFRDMEDVFKEPLYDEMEVDSE